MTDILRLIFYNVSSTKKIAHKIGKSHKDLIEQDFCKGCEKYCTHPLLMKKDHIIPKTSQVPSEIITIAIYFHLSRYQTFRWYYKDYVCRHLRQYFPRPVFYNRFIQIMQPAIAPLTLYLMKRRFGKSKISAEESQYKFREFYHP